MRIGEVCALRIEDIHEDHIKVCRTEVKCKIEGKSKVFARILQKQMPETELYIFQKL